MSNDRKHEACRQLLFVGTHGYVAALHQEDGHEVWRTSLPGTGYSVVSMVYEEGCLLCASGGHAFGLDPENGEILWRNNLAGLGHGLVCLTTADSKANGMQTVLAAQAAANARSSSSATHGTSS